MISNRNSAQNRIHKMFISFILLVAQCSCHICYCWNQRRFIRKQNQHHFVDSSLFIGMSSLKFLFQSCELIQNTAYLVIEMIEMVGFSKINLLTFPAGAVG